MIIVDLKTVLGIVLGYLVITILVLIKINIDDDSFMKAPAPIRGILRIGVAFLWPLVSIGCIVYIAWAMVKPSKRRK